MTQRDSRGRRRQPGQSRGLRPLYPVLESDWQSRPLRVAMPEYHWRLFDQLVSFFPVSTQARANGEAISYLLRRERLEESQWLDWDQQKQLRLLRHAAAPAAR